MKLPSTKYVLLLPQTTSQFASAASGRNKSSVDPTVTLIVSTPSANKVNNCRGYQFNPGLDEGKSRERLACRLTDRHSRSPTVFTVPTTCGALGFVENRKKTLLAGYSLLKYNVFMFYAVVVKILECTCMFVFLK